MFGIHYREHDSPLLLPFYCLINSCNLLQMHIVSLKKNYSVEQAIADPEGIAVLGFFINVCPILQLIKVLCDTTTATDIQTTY